MIYSSVQPKFLLKPAVLPKEPEGIKKDQIERKLITSVQELFTFNPLTFDPSLIENRSLLATLIEKEADQNKESLFYMLRIMDLYNKAEVAAPDQGEPVEIEATQVARIQQQALQLSRSAVTGPVQHVFPVVRF